MCKGVKKQIISLFNKNIKGLEICIKENNINYCGKEGYWLEQKLGIKHNNKNHPDINGYEMKSSSNKNKNRITLGDFSASEYAFSGKYKRNEINMLNKWTDEIKLSRSEFISTFGNRNSHKNNRYSWSGNCVPKYDLWNDNGQILKINENNDIIIYYSFSKDKYKINNYPLFLQNDNIVIALWKSLKMESHINNKFNKSGFFICKKVSNKYEKIYFGKPFNFEYFIQGIKDNKIIFDSGMYDGNNRNYSMFRGKNMNFWDELITEEY